MSTKKFAFELTGAGKRSIDGIPSILENIATIILESRQTL
jgi:hypothetical protein